MAFDGFTLCGITTECKNLLVGGRIAKIAQPEKDELLLTIKNVTGQFRLVLSASASLPLIYLTEENKKSPLTAPNFCMLLRKHIQNGKILDITQPGLERIMQIHIEHLDEMGDLCHKTLLIEAMGKHSNIIFVDEDQTIIDSLKHISGLVSSVREVLPGKPYFIPQTTNKLDPVNLYETGNTDAFYQAVFGKAEPLYKAVYTALTGFSPIMAQELCLRAGLDADQSALTFSQAQQEDMQNAFFHMMEDALAGRFEPTIFYENGKPAEYAVLSSKLFAADQKRTCESVSELLRSYYAEKETITRIRQKSADLRRIVQTALERTVKKYDLQCQQMKDTEKREKYRIYGELLHTYGYGAKQGDKSLKALNYYTNEEITIPLDPQLTAAENAKKYFARYDKLKRTYETLSELTKEVHDEILYLQSVSNALDMALKEEDLTEIKEELISAGYIKRKGGTKKEKITSKPYHYVSKDGFHMYVGKNNFQNDALTFQFATGNDMWFHAKGIPGSHVIVKTEGKELPDSAYEDAARLAAYYSSAREQSKVEIDYTRKKEVKKPPASKPGFVIYHTNYSMVIDTDISGLELLSN